MFENHRPGCSGRVDAPEQFALFTEQYEQQAENACRQQPERKRVGRAVISLSDDDPDDRSDDHSQKGLYRAGGAGGAFKGLERDGTLLAIFPSLDDEGIVMSASELAAVLGGD